MVGWLLAGGAIWITRVPKQVKSIGKFAYCEAVKLTLKVPLTVGVPVICQYGEPPVPLKVRPEGSPVAVQ